MKRLLSVCCAVMLAASALPCSAAAEEAGADALTITLTAHTHTAQTHVEDDPCAWFAYDLCDCGAVLYEGSVTDRGDTSLFSHKYIETVTQAPTCTEPGIMKKQCGVCGYETTAPIQSPGHRLQRVAAGTEADYPQEHWHCLRCNLRFADMAATEQLFAAEGGTLGNITWQLENGVLTLSGTGAAARTESDAYYPWEPFSAQITAVTVGEGITALGDYALAWLSAVTAVTLPDTLEEIGARCFAGDQALTALTLPESLRAVGEEAFLRCDQLFAAGTCKTLGGLLYAYSGDDLICHIPEGISVIADGAFASAKNMIAVFCPDSLRHIGKSAFADCAALTEAVLNDGLLSVGADAFSGCRSLKTVTVPEGVTEIGAQSDAALTEICGKAGSAAEKFARENGLAFRALTENPPDLTVNYDTDGWYFGNSAAVFGKSYALTDRDRALLDAVETVGTDDMLNSDWSGSCFGLCLTVLLAKNGLLSPAALQSGAETLAAVQPNGQIVSMINYYHAMQFAASYLRTQPSAVRGESDRQMLWRLIRTASQVQNGVSPLLVDMTTQNGRHAVLACGTEPGSWQFDGADYDGRVLVWDSNFPAALNEQTCIYYNTDSLTYCIPYYGVGSGTGGINTVTNDLAVLNAYPYPAEAPLPGDVNCDSYVNIADAVLLARFIAEDAEAPVSVRGRENAELDGEDGLTAADNAVLLEMLAGLTTYRAKMAGFSFAPNADGWTVSVTDPDMRDITIPAAYEEKPVTALCLDGAADVKWQSLAIPASVTEISMAGADMQSLLEFSVDAKNPCWQSIGGVLFDSFGQTLIRFPAARGDSYYTVPEGVTALADEAFYRCTALRSVDLPEGLCSIGSRCFAHCGLKSQFLPDSLTHIGEAAFAENAALWTVIIPGNVHTAERLFAGCKKLQTVFFQSTEPDFSHVFDDFTGHVNVGVPEGYAPLYGEQLAGAIAAGTVTIVKQE